MDSTITEGYENPDNAADVIKQVAYSANTMDFSHDNFPTNTQISSDGFHVSGEPYQEQQTSEPMYNPVESVQHLEYENQGHLNIENIASQDYYTPSETQYTTSYISEQSQELAPVHKNNGINEGNTEQYVGENIDNQNSEHFNDNVTGTAESNTNIEQPAVTEEDQPVKIESENTSKPVESTDNENGEKSIVSQQETETTNNQETLIEFTNNDKVQDEAALSEVVASNKKSNAVTESATETSAQVEPQQDSLQLTELQRCEPHYEEYSIVENLNAEGSISQTDSTQSETHEEVINVPNSEQEERQQDNVKNVDSPEPIEKKPRRTRKPVYEVPMHLFGHDINKPVDPVANGRALPKPRLGVKVPYRNLTSQIVSKAELEDVILERSRAKELASNKDDVKFARSLTQRLANKIAPEKGRKIKDKSSKNDKDTKKADPEKNEDGTSESSNLAAVDESKIQNNDDLLAILEGEGDEMPVLSKESPDNQADDSNLKLLEREIALQQLQELPSQEPKERILPPRFNPRPPIKSQVSPNLKSDKSHPSNLTPRPRFSDRISPKTNPPKKPSEIDIDVSSPVKRQIEIEPQVKVNMVLKTYSRKRKISDLPEFDMSSPKRPAFDEPELEAVENTMSDPLALPTNVYVTKSSRVIKKKVIWDPDDEQASRGAKVSVSKVVDTSRSTPTKISKPVPSPEKKLSEKLVEKSKPEPKPVVKSVEKSNEKVSPKKTINKKSPAIKPKRGLTEVDKLLMDEGAVKMLYDLKNDEPSGKRKKDIYSVEKAEKDIIKKANLLKNDLVQNTSNESPKNLRKKEGPSFTLGSPPKPNPILERKMSKESTKSSVHTPPRSPTLFSSQSSMLIRRRSSSSISSSDDTDESFTPKLTKSLKKLEGTKAKKLKRNAPLTENKKDKVNDGKSPQKDSEAKPLKGAQYKSFTVKKSGKHVSIDLNYIDDKCYLTLQVLEELISILKKLEKDKECNVLSITSTSKAFCLGLYYPSLVTTEGSERIHKATELTEKLREFLLCLLRFPKILVAGIQGECVGLGVTMLPLFDSVIASDTATFRTPYANLGCLGEATFLLTYPNLSNNGLAAELLYSSQTLKADEACRRGLISKLCWPEKYKETLRTFLSSIANGSRQSLEMTKSQLRANIIEEMEAAIDTEMEILIEHWTSPECQKNFLKIEN